MAWTLEYDGDELSFEEWGISQDNVTRQRSSCAADVVSVTVPGPADGALAFAYGAAVIIRRDGTVWFRGKAILPVRSGMGSGEGIVYRFAGPWWDFERLVFQQQWNYYNGDPDVLAVATTSELFLGQSAVGARLTTGAQITEALNWAIARGVAVQLGTIDAAANIPIYNVRDITVAEVIIQMLRWTPDIICWFDYTTSPPTFHARKLANLANVTVAASGATIERVGLTPKYDLQLPAVLLRFKQINTVDGVPWLVVSEQKYPGGATGLELGASVHTIELQGSSQTNVYGTLKCASCLAQSGVAATRVAWWKTKDALFSSPKIDAASLVIESASIVDDDTEVAIDLGVWPNELVDGHVAPWMSLAGGAAVVTKEARIKAIATYDLYVDDDQLIPAQMGRTKELSVRVKLTNGITGTYSAVESIEGGESEPAGLAQAIYDAHAVLQYEGELTLVADEVPGGLSIGNKLTIDTGSVTYANLLVQSVAEDLGSGRITLQLGYASQLGLTDLIELLRVNRYRLLYNNPATRVSAQGITAGSVTLGKNMPKQDTTTGLGNSEAESVSADAGTVGGSASTSVVVKDATNQKIVLQVVKNSDGTKNASAGSVVIKLSDLGVKDMAIKEWDVCIPDGLGGFTAKKAKFLSTDPYDP